MDCSLAALVACFSWSNLYIDAGILAQDRGETFLVKTITHTERQNPDGSIAWWRHREEMQEVEFKKNPFAKVAVAYEVTFDDVAGFGEVSVRVEALHVSSLVTQSDKGINSVGLYTRWRPFARR